MPQKLIDGYYLPVEPEYLDTVPQVVENTSGKAEIKVPRMLPNQISAILTALRDSRRLLDAKKENEIKGLFETHLEMWLNPQYEPRRLAEEILPVTLGYSPPMVITILDDLFCRLKEDLGSLTRSCKRNEILVTAYPDIPGPQVVATLQALFNGMGVFCKAPLQEPVFTALYAASLRDIDEILAKCVAAMPWDGGASENQILEARLYGDLTEKDMIVVFGSPEVATQIDTKKNPHTPLISYTRGVGVIIIGKDNLSKQIIQPTLQSCAKAISMYNGNACFSPQAIIVEGKGEVAPQEFAGLLSQTLAKMAHDELPVGDFSGDTYARFAQAHRTYRLQTIRGPINYYAVKDNTERPIGGVIYIKNGEFMLPKSGERVVTVIPIKDIADASSMLVSYREQIHTIGMGLEGASYERNKAIFENIGARVSTIEDMLSLSFRDYQFTSHEHELQATIT